MEKENYREMLKFNPEYENHVFLENEIFDKLHDLNLQWKKTAYAFAYYYFHLWAYRYAKYQLADGSFLTNSFINVMLGFAPKCPPMSGLIKKGGILEQAGILETVTDFPIDALYKEDEDGYGDLSFTMLEDVTEGDHRIKAQIGVPKKYAVKRPVAAFERGGREGVYFDMSNTLHIDFETFLYCMENEDIGVTGFYLYCFLDYLSFRNNGKMVYKSPEALSELTTGSPSTIHNLLMKMRDYNMASCDVKDYVKSEKKRQPNGYKVNDFEEFFYKKTAEPIRGGFRKPE